MSARPLIAVLAGSLLVAVPAFAQKSGGGDSKGSSGSSSSSGGGGGGGGYDSGGGYKPSGGGSDSGGSYKPSKGDGSGSSPKYGQTGGLSPAERRHPRPDPGHRPGGGGGYSPGYGRPYYYGGYRYYYPGGGYSGYWWPYGAYGWYGGYWGDPWGYAGGVRHTYVHREVGAIRVLVDPAETRVYVDGYYAGTVDDFDGLFQRLNVRPGRHEIALKLEGYRTHRLKVYVGPGRTLKLHHDMVRGSGDTFEDMAGQAPESEVRPEPARGDADESSAEAEGADEGEDDGGEGRLRLRVSPADASVYVDGAFRGTAREAASLRLPAGRHRLEIVRPGYRTLERDVEIELDETTTLSIEMQKPAI